MALGSPGGGEAAGLFLARESSLRASAKSGFRRPDGFLRLSFILVFSRLPPLRASIAFTISVAFLASLVDEELLLLDELLLSLESESLELAELDPELDFDIRLVRLLTLAMAAATASLLRALPKSSLRGAGGLAALLTRIIPGDGTLLLGAGGFIKAALSLAAFLSDTMIEGDTCLPPFLDREDSVRYADLDLDLYELLLV